MDQEQESNASGNKMVGKFVTDGLKEAWRKFMEKFQQSFDLGQLDSVLSFLRESESSFQNPSNKNKRAQLMELERESSPENNDDDNLESALEKKVFGIHLLAKSIFKCLSNSDLLSCRLVSSYFNEFATEIMLKRENEIKFHRKINRFYLWGSNWKSLDMLTQLLGTSKNFPCNKFVFVGGNLGNDDAQRFFNFYGSSIQGIRICHADDYSRNGMGKSETGFSVGVTDSRVIGRILSQQLPNLEDFALNLDTNNENEWSGYTSLLFPPEEKVELPNLKKLVYESSRGNDDDFLLRQLLVATPNLTSFKADAYFELGRLDNLIQTGKVKCITNLRFPNGDELDQLEEMLKHEPKLTDLEILFLQSFYRNSVTWRRISRLLTQLFNYSQNSIEKIDALPSLGFLPQFQLPVLPNIRHVWFNVAFYPPESIFNIEDIHDYSLSFLPRGATFSVNFPRLKSVEFSFSPEVSSEDSAEWWTKYFPTDEILPTVKSLKIWHSCPLLWMEKLSNKFPNLEDLSVSDIKDFPNVSKIIWTHYKKLKKLNVIIDLASPLNSYPALDSSFTGLSPEVCNQLGELSTIELESVAENCMGNEPSLLDLTDLENLAICLDVENFTMDLENYNYPTILSPLTGICVFKPLKSLEQVSIEIYSPWPNMTDEALIIQGLEPLTPYKVKITLKQ